MLKQTLNKFKNGRNVLNLLTKNTLHGQRAFSIGQDFDPSKDYYGVLGIDKGASKKDIKKAFVQMTKKYHPDKYKGKHLPC